MSQNVNVLLLLLLLLLFFFSPFCMVFRSFVRISYVGCWWVFLSRSVSESFFSVAVAVAFVRTLYLRAIILFSICTQTMSVVNDAFNREKKKADRTARRKGNKTHKAERPIKNHFERNEGNERKQQQNCQRVRCLCAHFFPASLAPYIFLGHIYDRVPILIAHYIFHVVCSATVSLLLFVRYSFFCSPDCCCCCCCCRRSSSSCDEWINYVYGTSA